MKNHRRNERGRSASCLIVVVCLLGLGVYFWARGGSDEARGLAARMPADSIGAWAVSNAQPKELMVWLKQAVTLTQAKNRRSHPWEELSAELGQDPVELASYFNGQAYGSSRSDEGEIQMFMALGLADPEGFAGWYQEHSAGNPEGIDVEGVTFQKHQDGLIGWDENWLYLTGDTDSAEFYLKFANDGGDNLADSPYFEEGLDELKVSEYDAFVLLNFDRIGEEVKRVKQQEISRESLAQLFSFRYAMATWRYDGWEVNAILAPQGEKFGVASKLCRPGGMTGQALNVLSDDTKNYVCADLQWFQNAALGLMDLHSTTRNYSTMLTLAIALKGNPWASFSGEVAATTDLPALIEDALKEDKAKREPLGNLVVVASSKDLDRSRKFLGKALGQDLSDEEIDLGQGARVRFKSSAVSLLLGSEADSLTRGGGAKVAALKRALKWGDGGVVYLDHWDLTESVDLLIGKLADEQDEEAKIVLEGLKFLRQEFGTLDGTTCFAASEKGLRYRASGPVNSLLIVSWASLLALAG